MCLIVELAGDVNVYGLSYGIPTTPWISAIFEFSRIVPRLRRSQPKKRRKAVASQKELLMPISGRAQAKETAGKNLRAGQQRKSA
jgi:hypothetical protein